jgi:hypothetical protein
MEEGSKASRRGIDTHFECNTQDWRLEGKPSELQYLLFWVLTLQSIHEYDINVFHNYTLGEKNAPTRGKY